MKEDKKNRSEQGRRRFLKAASIVTGACLAPSTVSAESNESIDPSNINTSFNPEKTNQTYKFANNLSAIESEKTQDRIYDSLTAAQQSSVDQALQIAEVTVEEYPATTEAEPASVIGPNPNHTYTNRGVKASTFSGGTAYTYTNHSSWDYLNGDVSNVNVRDKHTAPAYGWSFVKTLQASIPRQKSTYFYSYVKGKFSYSSGVDSATPHVKIVGDGQGNSRVLNKSKG